MRRKNGEPNVSGDGHIKFRVIEFEIDGDNGTLAEGIKALTTALSKTAGPTAIVQQQRPALPPTAPKGTTTATDPAIPVEGELFPETESDTEEQIESTSGNGAAPAKPKKPTPPPRTPDVLNDIDLNAGTKMSLKDYIAQKAPNGPFETYATITVWYKENHGIDEVNDDRIYTAYRFLDMIPPNDVGSILRQLKHSKWFDKAEKKAHYKINIVGLNKVHGNFK
jgi:hypothetical protein